MNQPQQSPRDTTEQLLTIEPFQFEHFLADLWERKGWDTTVSSESADQGIDVRATKEYPYDQTLLIQAKRYGPETTVGSPEVQQYASLRDQEPGVDKVAIVTTNGFTEQAEEMAKRLNVKLIGGDELAEIIYTEDAEDLLNEYSNHHSNSNSDSDRNNNTGTQDSDPSGQQGEREEERASILGGYAEDAETAGWLTLTPGEEIQWSGRPSMWVVATDVLAGALLIAGGFGLSLVAYPWTINQGFSGWVGAVPLLLSLVGVIISAGSLLQWVQQLYVITDDEVYSKEGLISRDVTQIHRDNVQHSEYDQSIRERVFGYGDVRVFTSGSGDCEMVFQSVSDPEYVRGLLCER